MCIEYNVSMSTRFWEGIMYCIYCKREQNGVFCGGCGHKNISSQEAWERWKGVYSNYYKEQLEEIIDNEKDYQEDAIVAARYLKDTYIDEVEDIVEPEVMQDAVWYYSCGGERKGPITENELIKLYQEGFMRKTSAVWKNGFSNWTRLDEAGVELPDRNNQLPPPVDIENVNNGPFMFLLFIPVVSVFIQYLIAAWLYVDVIDLWWVSYIINTVCCCIDYYIVKKAGYDADKLTMAFLFLTPAYIYKRMKLVKGRKWLATIVWIIVFTVAVCIPDLLWVKLVGVNPGVIRCVQEGRFDSYPELEVGKMFEQALTDSEWDTHFGSHNRVLVVVKGKFEGEKFETIFELDIDNSFEISSMRLAGRDLSKLEIKIVLNKMNEMS